MEDPKGQEADTAEFTKHLKSVLEQAKDEPKQDPSPFSVKREKVHVIF